MESIHANTKGLTKVKIDVMQHFLDGGEIEFISKTCPLGLDGWTTWAEDYEPLWDWVAFDYRIKKTPKFRLPTKEEFDNLIDNFSRWDREKKGIEILNKKGDILFFPAKGYQDSIGTRYIDSRGYYWSSTLSENDNNNAPYLRFASTSKCINCCYSKGFKHNVRLVSDEPFEGGVEFNGIYWKPENEDGYYTYEEAMDKF